MKRPRLTPKMIHAGAKVLIESYEIASASVAETMAKRIWLEMMKRSGPNDPYLDAAERAAYELISRGGHPDSDATAREIAREAIEAYLAEQKAWGDRIFGPYDGANDG